VKQNVCEFVRFNDGKSIFYMSPYLVFSFFAPKEEYVSKEFYIPDGKS